MSTIGSVRVSSRARIRSAASRPFMPGSIQSRTTRPNGSLPPFRLRCSRSASPSSAVATDTGEIDQLRRSVSSSSRLVSVSSTMRTGRSATAAGATRVGARAWASTPSRAVKTKVVPLPGVLSTVRSPPMSRASRRLITRPSPVPPYFRVVELSACVNDWKSLACCSGEIPMPVSVTLTRRNTSPGVVRLAGVSHVSTFTSTSPFSVNLNALLIRLVRT